MNSDLVKFNPDLGFFLKDPVQVFSLNFPFDQLLFSSGFLSGLQKKPAALRREHSSLKKYKISLFYSPFFCWDPDCISGSVGPN